MQELLSSSPILANRVQSSSTPTGGVTDEEKMHGMDKREEVNPMTDYNSYFTYDPNGSNKSAAAAVAAALHQHYQTYGGTGVSAGFIGNHHHHHHQTMSLHQHQQQQQQQQSAQYTNKPSLNWRLTPPSSGSSKNSSPSAATTASANVSGTNDSNSEYNYSSASTSSNQDNQFDAQVSVNQHQPYVQTHGQQSSYHMHEQPKSIFSTIYSNELNDFQHSSANNRNGSIFSTVGSNPFKSAVANTGAFSTQYNSMYGNYYPAQAPYVSFEPYASIKPTDSATDESDLGQSKRIKIVTSPSFMNTSPSILKQQLESSKPLVNLHHHHQQQQSQLLSSSLSSNSSSFISSSSPTSSSSNSNSANVNNTNLKPDSIVSPKQDSNINLQKQTSTPSSGTSSSSSSSSSSSVSSTSSITLSSNSGTPLVSESFEWMKPAKSQSNGKTRTKDKYRVVYSEPQRVELEKEFLYSKYITIKRKSELSSTLNLSERQIKIWFQNRRAKERKSNRKQKLDNNVSSTTKGIHGEMNMKMNDFSDDDDEEEEDEEENGDYENDQMDNERFNNENSNANTNMSADDESKHNMRLPLTSSSNNSSSSCVISPIADTNGAKSTKESKAKSNRRSSKVKSQNLLLTTAAAAPALTMAEQTGDEQTSQYLNYPTVNQANYQPSAFVSLTSSSAAASTPSAPSYGYNQYTSLFGSYTNEPQIYQQPASQGQNFYSSTYASNGTSSLAQPIYTNYQPFQTQAFCTQDYGIFNYQPNQTIECNTQSQQPQQQPPQQQQQSSVNPQYLVNSSAFNNDYLSNRALISQLNSKTAADNQQISSPISSTPTASSSLLVANVLSQFPI